MFKRFVRAFKAKLYVFLVKFDESLEERYDAKIRQAEEQFQKIETRLKGNRLPDFEALTKSLEAATRLTAQFDKQSARVIDCIETEFPEMRGKFENMFDAVSYLKVQYRQLKKQPEERQ